MMETQCTHRLGYDTENENGSSLTSMHFTMSTICSFKKPEPRAVLEVCTMHIQTQAIQVVKRCVVISVENTLRCLYCIADSHMYEYR
jgi:hypothetical protein